MQRFFHTMYASAIPVRWRVMLNVEPCDRMSACAESARKLISLIQRHHGTPQRDLLNTDDDIIAAITTHHPRDLIMKLLNHDGLLLGNYACNTLAVLTVHEAIRSLLWATPTDTATLEYLEALEKDLLLPDRYPSPEGEAAKHVQLLTLKHLGRGVDYVVLQNTHRRSTTTTATTTTATTARL